MPMLRRRPLRPLVLLAAVAAAGLGVAGCGDDDAPADTGVEGRRGGTLTVLLPDGPGRAPDPGAAQEGFALELAGELGRTLYAYAPPRYSEPVPDAAAGPPRLSDGGRTVTVRLRAGLRFSPPVNRTVIAEDVAYAISRVLAGRVANREAVEAFGDIEGADAFRRGVAPTVSGLQTPSEDTLVFRLARPAGAPFLRALSSPATAPVPPEYAAKFDRERPSEYAAHQVATGPYMLKAKLDGTVEAGAELRLVRNPNWDRDGDFRDAFADAITVRAPEDGERADGEDVRGTIAARATRTGAGRPARSSDVGGPFAPRTGSWDLAFASLGNSG